MLKKILIAGHSAKTKNYENALEHLGVSFITTLHVPDATLYDGLILPGGGDVDPLLFGQLNHGSHQIEPEFDRIQLAVLKTFILDKKPVLGICKGMQLINIYFGGDIIQHLPTAVLHEYCGHDQTHMTTASPASFLAGLYGLSFSVNSAHHQGVDIPGQGINYLQYAQDHTIEGLMHQYLPIIGVQWHPERMCFDNRRTDTVDGSRLFHYFLDMQH